MACHTLSESAKITGKSRRTIQRYVKAGKVSVNKDINGNSFIDTAELIRVFGELSHPVTQKMSQPVTVTEYSLIADEISKAIIKANKPLLEQISELTEQVKHLTYRLDKPKEVADITIKQNKNVTIKSSNEKNYIDDIPFFGKR